MRSVAHVLPQTLPHPDIQMLCIPYWASLSAHRHVFLPRRHDSLDMLYLLDILDIVQLMQFSPLFDR